MGIDKGTMTDLKQRMRHHENDTGSLEVQIVQLTGRIKELTEHLKENPKDFSSKRGMFQLVNRRKNFLAYLKKHNTVVYRTVVGELGLRY